MPHDTPKKKIEKVEESPRKGDPLPHTKEEPASQGGSGGMIGEGDTRDGREGGMKNES